MEGKQTDTDIKGGGLARRSVAQTIEETVLGVEALQVDLSGLERGYLCGDFLLSAMKHTSGKIGVSDLYREVPDNSITQVFDMKTLYRGVQLFVKTKKEHICRPI